MWCATIFLEETSCVYSKYPLLRGTWSNPWQFCQQHVRENIIWVKKIAYKYSECSVFRHPPSQLIGCRIKNRRNTESNYIAKYSSRPINYPFKLVGLWNVGLLGGGLSSNHCNMVTVVSFDHFFQLSELLDGVVFDFKCILVSEIINDLTN